MVPIRFFRSKIMRNLFPIILALLIAIAYFLSVVPNSRPYWGKYVLAMAVLLVLDRIFMSWYIRARLLGPIISYKRGKRAGKSFSQGELEKFFQFLASYIPRYQLASGVAWVIAIVCLALISFFLIQASLIALIGIIFTGIIAGVVSTSLSYFILKARTSILMEEILSQLEHIPDVSAYRVKFNTKVGLSVAAFVALAFAAYGVLFFSSLNSAINDFALRSGTPSIKAVTALLKSAPEGDWKTILAERKGLAWSMAAIDEDGRIIKGASSGSFSEHAIQDAVPVLKGLNARKEVLTDHGKIVITPVGGGRFLVLLANSRSLHSIFWRLTLSGGIFLVLALMVLGGYVMLLSADSSSVLRRAAKYSMLLAEGDLTRIPAIWSDDELGMIGDSLRMTFQGLVRIAGEVSSSANLVEREVTKTTGVVGGLHQKVTQQTDSADKTRKLIEVLESKMLNASSTIEQVASSTQEVSSAILQMQASVEEIARNADVLSQSVETTVSSSNEIAMNAQEVSAATGRLQSSGQEAISFLSELEASLEETKRNSENLLMVSNKMTEDAESGFSSVAAVEDEILHTKTVSEQSRSALSELMDSVAQIGRIVDMIQDVTEQTNLLSLNASIIAAGAGEYGKPFAVVATQIRELSARTAANAKEIRAVIDKLTGSTHEMTEAMEKTTSVVDASTLLSKKAGEALRTIIESASDQQSMSKHIAAATDELAHGGQSANRAMQGIFEMIEGIAKAMEEMATSTQFLNEESEKVREVSSQIRNATGEQAKGAGVISQAITKIREQSVTTSEEVQSQTKETVSIMDAMASVVDAARAIEDTFGQLSSASSQLQKASMTLKQEIRVFRTE